MTYHFATIHKGHSNLILVMHESCCTYVVLMFYSMFYAHSKLVNVTSLLIFLYSDDQLPYDAGSAQYLYDSYVVATDDNNDPAWQARYVYAARTLHRLTMSESDQSCRNSVKVPRA